jgi:hypothetical protein
VDAGTHEKNSLEWLQSWYCTQCNGEWEHSYGIKIDSLDNPGWWVKIDLTGTALEDVPMEEVDEGMEVEGSENWLHCKVAEKQFQGAGGALSLFQICDVFRLWAEGQGG